MYAVILGILIPFFGTTLGAALVLFMNKNISNNFQKLLLGFVSGVMVAASIWSLIIPSINQCKSLGKLSFLPAAVGVMLGFIFLLIIDRLTEKLQNNENKKSLLVFSVTLHNIPEGLAVGVAFAGAYFGEVYLSISAAIALSVGMAIQNIPEGAIVSLPKRLGGASKSRSFLSGFLSGIVEPIFAFIAFFITGLISKILPYVLSFSAGSMLFVVVQEIIPEMQENNKSVYATFGFCLGFILMMILDVMLG